MPLPHRPWANTFWLPGGQVLCGEYPSDLDPSKAKAKLQALAEFGVTTYIDLTTSDDNLRPYEPLGGAEVHKWPIVDVSVPAESRMLQILDTIDAALAQNRVVYVHCWGGVGRTGTVAGCWLRRHGASHGEAFSILAERWSTVEKFNRKPEIPETEEQRLFIRNWSEPGRGSAGFYPYKREQLVRGTLLGGAVGDALGAPVEFMKLAEIKQKFGAKGIQNFSPAYGKLGAITDDTQMTMFTAEGMLRWESRLRDHGMASHDAVLAHAYLRWLRTQGEFTDKPSKFDYRGWLYHVPELHSRRGPGATCLSALKEIEVDNFEFRNTSKGCGGVMRAAPCGLLDKFPLEDCYEFGRDGAKLTHHHPEGFVSAGVLALLIGAIREGATLRDAAERALGAAALRRKEAPLTFKLLEKAIHLAIGGKKPSPAKVASLGEGWVAEEALAIGVYCALVADGDFAAGVRLAVNHDGDSDSTGAICGNILGASLGVQAIPYDWLSALELRDAITQLADDMVTRLREGRGWMQAYPPH